MVGELKDMAKAAMEAVRSGQLEIVPAASEGDSFVEV
jgi:hypothetical protein